MDIGIIGAGNIGAALAEHFVRLRHAVRIANSRGPDTLVDVARRTGATPVPVSGVAQGVDLLVVAIPLKGVRALPKYVLDGLRATSPILDTGNYYPRRDGAIAEIDAGAIESEWTARTLGRPVIKVFNNIVADSLLRGARPSGSKSRIALPVSGDDDRAKQATVALLNAIGFDGLDGGPLSESWRQQPGTPAYGADPSKEQLPGLLARADRVKALKSRDQAARLMARLPPDFPPQELVRAARLSAGLDTWRPRSWLAALRIGLTALAARS